MSQYLTPLLQLQRFFLPGLILLTLWAIWRTTIKRDFAVGLGLYLALVILVDGFLNTGLYVPGLERGSIRYSEICAVFLFLNRPPASERSGPYMLVNLLVGIYFASLVLSGPSTSPMMPAILEFRIRIVPQIVAFVVALRGLRSSEDLRRFFLCISAFSLVVGLFVFWDVFFDRWLLHSDMLSHPMYTASRNRGRFGGIFLNPNFQGAFSVLVMPALFMWGFGETNRRMKYLAWAGLLSLVFCLIETQSRGPLIALGVALPVLLLGPAGEASRVKRAAVFVPLLVVLTLAMPGFWSHAMERFDSIDNEMSSDSARTRQSAWTYTRRAIADNPLTGIGFGEQNFLAVMREYGVEQDYGEEPLDNPHNSYLQMAAYAGLPTLGIFILFNVLLLLKTGRMLLGQAGPLHMVAFGIAVGVVGFLASIYPDMHMFTQSVGPAYWVFFALLLSLATAREQAAVDVVAPSVRIEARRPSPHFVDGRILWQPPQGDVRQGSASRLSGSRPITFERRTK